jgi:hypothetical protein
MDISMIFYSLETGLATRKRLPDRGCRLFDPNNSANASLFTGMKIGAKQRITSY